LNQFIFDDTSVLDPPINLISWFRSIPATDGMNGFQHIRRLHLLYDERYTDTRVIEQCKPFALKEILIHVSKTVPIDQFCQSSVITLMATIPSLMQLTFKFHTDARLSPECKQHLMKTLSIVDREFFFQDD
jgi:hypothetical protein